MVWLIVLGGISLTESLAAAVEEEANGICLFGWQQLGGGCT